MSIERIIQLFKQLIAGIKARLTAVENDNRDIKRQLAGLSGGNSGGNSGGSTPYDCSSGYLEGFYDATRYAKITIPNTSTILDLTIKQDIDYGGAMADQYDFVTWRLHLRGNFCTGQCSTIIQDATPTIPTLYYTADDEFIYIYFGYMGASVEAYIKGIIENIHAEFEVIDILPADAVEFAMRSSNTAGSNDNLEEALTSIIELQEMYMGTTEASVDAVLEAQESYIEE